jgi:winged helix DNA-binding protein
MRPRSVTQRRLTVSLVDRQLLLSRAELPAPAAVRRLAALQAQYPPSPYFALFARVAGFEVDHLERALRRGTVVKATLMRATLHLVAGTDYPSFAVAWRQQHLTDVRGRHRDVEVDEAAVTAGVRELLRRPRTAAEIKDCVDELSGGAVRPADRLHYARALVPMRHVFPSGGWRHHRAFTVVAKPEDLAPVEPAATALLLRRYLAAFGPATREDMAHFTYLRYRQLDPALAELGATVRYTDESGRELYDLPRAPLPDEDTPTPVRFLPNWDAALLSHADRTRILPTRWHDRVVKSANGGLLASYLLDGQVAGLWTVNRTGSAATMRLTPFVPIPDAMSAEVEREALRTLRFAEPDATDLSITTSATP